MKKHEPGTIENPTVGCDPEVFIFDRKNNLCDANDFIPGTKKEPFKVAHGAIQVDGISAEFNIDPADNFEEFNRNINAVVAELYKHIPKGYTLRCFPSVAMPVAQYNLLPERSKELGCDPDFVSPSIVPREPWNRVGTNFCGSGHIHIGWTKDENIEDPSHKTDAAIVTQVFENIWRSHYQLTRDPRGVRDQFYGIQGVYRPKPYGVECRSPSNLWLLEKAYRNNMFYTAKEAVKRAVKRSTYPLPSWEKTRGVAAERHFIRPPLRPVTNTLNPEV